MHVSIRSMIQSILGKEAALHARRTYSWAPYALDITVSRDTGLVRREALRDAPVQVLGESVSYDGLRDLSFRCICV